jgi:hypothetical protein
MDVWGKIIKNIFSIQTEIVEITKNNEELGKIMYSSLLVR